MYYRKSKEHTMRFERICLSSGVKRRAITTITRAVVKLKGNNREMRGEREDIVRERDRERGEKEREHIIFIHGLKRITTNQKTTCQTQKIK